MAAQRAMLDRWLLDQEIEAALRKVYGDAALDAVPPKSFHLENVSVDESLLLKEKLALAKTRLLVQSLKSKIR